MVIYFTITNIALTATKKRQQHQINLTVFKMALFM